MCVCVLLLNRLMGFHYSDGILGSNLFLFFYSELGMIVESSEIIHVAER